MKFVRKKKAPRRGDGLDFTLQVRVRPEDNVRIGRLARARGLSKSDVVREWIQFGLEKK